MVLIGHRLLAGGLIRPGRTPVQVQHGNDAVLVQQIYVQLVIACW